MVSASLRNVLVLVIALLATGASARQPLTSKPAMFGTKNLLDNNAADNTQDEPHIELRGGSMTTPRWPRWGILQEVKDDLLQAHSLKDNSRCSAEQVLHECVINYGSVMLGRF